MNGPEHYAEAERLIALAETCDWTTPWEPYRDPALAAAQVHATLALAAATANQWRRVDMVAAVRSGAEQGKKDGAR